MNRRLLLLVLLSAKAWGFSALLLDADAQSATPAATPSGASDAPLEVTPRPAPTVAPSVADLADRHPTWMTQAGAGAAAALVFVPTSLYLGAWLGTLSNNLYAALVPSLLVMALLPSLAVSLAVTLVGNWVSPGTYRFWPTFAATTLVNIGALVIAGFAGLSAAVFLRVVVFTFAEAIVLPATATATSALFAREKRSETLAGQAWRSNDPRAPLTWVVPTGEVHF